MNLPLFQPFANEWILFSCLLIAISSLVSVIEYIRIRLNLNPVSTRKFIHISVGLLVSFSPFYFESNHQLIALSLIFIVVNSVLLSIPKFASMAGLNHKSYGTVFYPLAFLCLVLFWWDKPISLVISMAVMTIADTLAWWIGTHLKSVRSFKVWNDRESIEGSLTMFLATFFIVYTGTEFFTWYFRAAFFLPLPVLLGLSTFTAMTATLAEATSTKGSDNFTIPIATFLAYDLFLVNYTHGTLNEFIIWILISSIIFRMAWLIKSLSLSGFFGGFLMGIIIFGAGGIQWITPMVIFFITASILSKLSRSSKSELKSHANRDISQVLANGGVGLVLAIVNFYNPNSLFFLVYLGAVSSATADTFATEIGALSSKDPKNIITFIPVKKGTSGGVTFLGMIGASIQSIFQCTICGQETEKRIHCESATRHIRGWKWVDNEMVNFINTITGGIIVFGVMHYYG